MRLLRILLMGLSVVGVSCMSAPDSSVGINRSEMKALVESYYWKRNEDQPVYTQSDLERIMDRSIDPTLDGDRAEGQASAVTIALASAGDEMFAEALSTRTSEVQKAVTRNVRYLFSHYNLDYPKTAAIVNKY